MLLSTSLTQVASGSAINPVISQFAVSQSSLPSGGGMVEATATVTNASNCYYNVTSYAADFESSSKISEGNCDQNLTVPANPLAVTMYVVVSISVSGPRLFSAPIEQEITITVAPNILAVPSTSTTTTTFPSPTKNSIAPPAGPDALLSVGSHIWVASCDADTVTEIDALNHEVIQELTSPQYGFVCPGSLALIGDNIWVADTRNNSITVLNASTGDWVQTLAGPGILSPSIITFTGSNVWVTSSASSMSSILSPSGVYVGREHGGPVLVVPNCIASTGADVWVADPLENHLIEYNARTGVYVRSSQPVNPTCVSYHGGLLWVSTDFGNDNLYEFSSSSGAILRVLSNTFTGGTLFFDGKALFEEGWRLGKGESLQEFTPSGTFLRTLVHSNSGSRLNFVAMAVNGNELWAINGVSQKVSFFPIN